MDIKVLLYPNGDNSSIELIYSGDSRNVNDASITLNQLESREAFIVMAKQGPKKVRVYSVESSISAKPGGGERKYVLVPIDIKTKDIKIV
ncbi:hypothetical protein MHB65_18015 [Lysinibacillus sp. FSL K6-0075]|uniref:hypothetical protein n=1 Tax=Lysinibacillus sp. FSL K6-0075 TaxID=2921415 RepID=UPI003158F0D5